MFLPSDTLADTPQGADYLSVLYVVINFGLLIRVSSKSYNLERKSMLYRILDIISGAPCT